MEHAELMRELNRILNYLFDDNPQPKKKDIQKTWLNWSGLATGHRRKHTYMYEQRELFKDYLRGYQKPVFNELLNAGQIFS